METRDFKLIDNLYTTFKNYYILYENKEPVCIVKYKEPAWQTLNMLMDFEYNKLVNKNNKWMEYNIIKTENLLEIIITQKKLGRIYNGKPATVISMVARPVTTAFIKKPMEEPIIFTNPLYQSLDESTDSSENLDCYDSCKKMENKYIDPYDHIHKYIFKFGNVYNRRPYDIDAYSSEPEMSYNRFLEIMTLRQEYDDL